jgi:hypothetical protein
MGYPEMVDYTGWGKLCGSFPVDNRWIEAPIRWMRWG